MAVRLMMDNWADDATLTANSASADFPASNTRHPWCMRHWRSTGCAAEWLKWNLGSAMTVKAFCLRYHNISDESGWSVHIQGNNADAWGAPAVDVDLINMGDAMAYFWESGETYQWWRLTIADAGNPNGYIIIGRTYLGSYIEMDWGYRVHTPQMIDPSEISESFGRQVFSTNRERYYVKKYRFDAISKTTGIALANAYADLGMSEPYFICEDTDSPTSRTFYIQNMTEWTFNPVGPDYYGPFEFDAREAG